MTTLQNTIHSVPRTRIALIAIASVAALAVTIALIASGGANQASLPRISSTSAQPAASPPRQLEAVAGARYGTVRPGVTKAAVTQSKLTPEEQLQAVAGARPRPFHQRYLSGNQPHSAEHLASAVVGLVAEALRG